MSDNFKRPSFLFLLCAGFIIGIGFWLGSDIFPSLLSSENIWDSILIILGFISIINFIAWFLVALLWNVFLSEETKNRAAYKANRLKIPDTDEFYNITVISEFNLNVRLTIATWGWITVIFSGLMIWIFWESVFYFILSIAYASFYILEIITGNENILQESLEESGGIILVVWPVLLFGVFGVFVKYLMQLKGIITEIKNSIRK